MAEKRAILKEYFGHSEFRSGQEQVVDSILQGRDVLCVMPTGAGKSVCYQVPALMFGGVTLVISPLISLMKDQVNALTQNGISAAYLNSSLSMSQYAGVLEDFRHGAYKILYVAPERLDVADFLRACREIRVDLLAVDEAHCISQWGQDFRPSYLKIANFANALWHRPIIAAFTATATAEVKDDIEYSLELRSPFRITTGFDRPNLRFEVKRGKKKMSELLKILHENEGASGIVYCSTRKAVEELGASLAHEGFPVTIYHAGLDDDVRKQNQEDFVYDRKNVMVATNAFGMGIDKSNVSYVVHYNIPQDVESYYQEAGRAGRDGSEASCILLYNRVDVHTNQYLIDAPDPNPDLTEEQRQVLKARAHERLKQMVFYATGNTCLRSFMLEYFGEKAPNYCGNCSNCLTQFEQFDITVEAQKILSCIKRTGERFGTQMICDVLRASKNDKVLRRGLDRQTAYGLLAGYSQAQLREMIEHLEFEGYIVSSGGEYPVLCLGERAHAVLFEGEQVIMQRAKPRESTMPNKRRGRGRTIESVDLALFAELKALRRKIADENKVPAYIVFSDATLVDMCKKHPTTHWQLLDVMGVGNVKADMYGARFLKLLQTYGNAKGVLPKDDNEDL